MTIENKNSFYGWVVAVFGIPITAIITWVFVAGGIVTDVRTNAKNIEIVRVSIEQLDTRVRSLELGMERIKVQYETILSNLSDIKVAINEHIKVTKNDSK